MDILNKVKFDFTLQSLLGDLSVKQFVDQYWEEKALLVQREDEGFYNELLTMADLDELLSLHKFDTDRFRMVNTSKGFVHPNQYMKDDGMLDLRKVYKYYSDGYSITFNKINVHWAPVKKLCYNLRSEFSHHIQTNLYLTPQNNVAFTPHTDTHDVLILQIAGRKHWQLYDTPYDTPLIEHTAFSHLDTAKLEGKRDLILEAGDLLYIPRGIPHNAYTTDRSSLHLTVGVYPKQWLDLVREVFLNRASSEVQLRKALPFGYLNDDEAITSIKNTLEQMITNYSLNGEYDQAVQKFKNDMRIFQATTQRGTFNNLDRVNEIKPSTRLRKKKGQECDVQMINETHCRLIYGDQSMKGPKAIKEAFEFIRDVTEDFSPTDLPVPKAAHQIQICKRLIRGGLIQVK